MLKIPYHLRKIIFIALFSIKYNFGFCWGFFAHKKINNHAIFSLPEEMLDFYVFHQDYITQNSVTPDKRRYLIKNEAPKHYIDIDYYNDDFFETHPKSLREAIKRYTKEIVELHGSLPWTIEKEKQKLIRAFREKDVKMILKISSELGHYLADANVPLHTTENYNGKKTNQEGIHAFWESRIPELFYDNFDLFIGKAEYISDTNIEVWKSIKEAHLLVNELLDKDKFLTKIFPKHLKYCFIQKNKNILKVISKEYSAKFNELTNFKVEAQMRKAIKLVSSFWMTCWVDAGKPNLKELIHKKLKTKDLELEKSELSDRNRNSRLCD